MWFDAGADVSVTFDYLVDGEFVVPASASYKVRSFAGTLLVSAALVPTTTTELVTIPAVHNALEIGNSYENRFVELAFVHNGHLHTQRLNYQISVFVPTTATPEAVRAEIGLDMSELPNSDIDVIRAYHELVDTYGTAVESSFILPGTRSMGANQAVVVKAALNVSESFELRTAVQSRSENHQFARKANIDFEMITTRLRAKLAHLVNVAQGGSAVGSSVFVLSNPTDVVTG